MDILIETHGSKLKVKNDIFLIEAENKKMEVSPVNVKSFVIKAKASITTSAIALALKNNIELVLLDDYDKPYCRLLNTQFSKSGYLRQCQYKFFNSHFAIEISKIIIFKKARKQKEHLLSLKIEEDKISKEILKIDLAMEKLKNSNFKDTEEIMGIEGNISKIYYAVLSKSLQGRFTFNNRSTRPAKDEFNASLNYLYGILYRKVEKALLLAGFDLNTGFLHTNKEKSLSLVFDFIELFRHYAMELNYRLYKGKGIRKSYFEILEKGIGISREGKGYLISEFNDYLNSSEVYNDISYQRNKIIQLEAYKFSEIILDLDKNNSI